MNTDDSRELDRQVGDNWNLETGARHLKPKSKFLFLCMHWETKHIQVNKDTTPLRVFYLQGPSYSHRMTLEEKDTHDNLGESIISYASCIKQ